MTAKAALLPDRSVLQIAGEDRKTFLQGLVTNDVESLREGEARFAGLLSPQGKILFDFFIVPYGETLLLDCPRTMSADLAKRLALYRLRAKVTIEDVSDPGVLGPSGAMARRRGPRQTRWSLIPILVFPGLGFARSSTRRARPRFSASFDDYEANRIALAIPEGG